MTDPMVAWEAACRAVDEQRIAARQRIPISIDRELRRPEMLALLHALFPYPPKPEESKGVEAFGCRYRRYADCHWERYGITGWHKLEWNDAYVVALASLLPKADRQRIAEAP